MKFTIQLLEEEYTELLVYEITRHSSVRRIRFFLHFSIPLLFLIVAFSLRLKNIVIWGIFIVFSVFWWMAFFPPLWDKIASLQVKKRFQQQEFQAKTMDYFFEDRYVAFQNTKRSYADLLGIVPLSSGTAIYFRSQSDAGAPLVILIPDRSFQTKEQKQHFINILEERWAQFAKS